MGRLSVIARVIGKPGPADGDATSDRFLVFKYRTSAGSKNGLFPIGPIGQEMSTMQGKRCFRVDAMQADKNKSFRAFFKAYAWRLPPLVKIVDHQEQ